LISNYLQRFQNILDAPKNTKEENIKNRVNSKEKSINALKRMLYEIAIVKPEKIPESYWKNQATILIERGE
jgi:hypothetical protein